MKTIINKTGKKRSWPNILLLAIVSIAMTLATTNNTSAQTIKNHMLKADEIINKADIHKVDTNYTFKWNKDSARYELFSRELKYFNGGNNEIAVINQRKTGDNGWQYYDRIVKSYNEKGQLIESLKQKWSNQINEWVNLQIKTISYTDFGEKSEVLYHEWRQAVERWISTTRYLITYNLRNEENNIMIQTYNPSTDSWNKHLRYSFIYENYFSKPDATLVEEWDDFSQTWKNRGKYLIDYDFYGNRVEETHVNWNLSLEQWVNALHYKRKYSKKQLMSEILQRYNYQNNKWNNAVKNEFEYDNSGDLVRSTEEEWNRDSMQWVVKEKYLYSDSLLSYTCRIISGFPHRENVRHFQALLPYLKNL